MSRRRRKAFPMMGPIVCGVRFFVKNAKGEISPHELRRSRNGCLMIMHAMMGINMEYLQCYPKAPTLYSCDGRDAAHPVVIYQEEPKGSLESFDSFPIVMGRGWGDCDDLAAIRCAELRVRGNIQAVPYIKWRPAGDARANVYHACVQWPDGRIEDPSLALGMAGHPITRKPVWIAPGPMPKADETIPGDDE